MESSEETSNNGERSNDTIPFHTKESISTVNAEQMEIDRLSSLVTDLNARLVACQQHYETILAKQKEDNSREKQSTVMRYAQAEKAKLDADKRCDVLTAKNNEFIKERENLQGKLNEFKQMNSKLQHAYETKLTELTSTKKEFEKMKELNQSIDATLVSTLNHLKGESAHLKEQREINERLKKDLQEQHEINDQLHLQIKQLNSAVQSVPTDDDRTQAFNELSSEHEALKTKLTTIQEENQRIREKLKSVEEDRFALENVVDNFRQNALKEKENSKKLYDDLLAAREEDSLELSRLKQIENLHHQTLADNADLRQLLEKEHQFLALTQTLTEKNSILQSDYEQVRQALEQKTIDYDKMSQLFEEQREKILRLEETEKCFRSQLRDLEGKYRNLSQSHEQIVKENEDLRIEIVALKKKHQANTKDLIKQLQQLQKPKNVVVQDEGSSPSVTSQLKASANKENSTDNASSRGSRTSSNCSLNEIVPTVTTDQAVFSPPDEEQEVIVSIVDIDRQKLIEKLIKQQKLLVRRNEKIEFLNDHIQLLTQDLQNKRRIIQSYAMNEDGFIFSSNQSDSVKQQLAQKSRLQSSSLMATLYNRATTASHQATQKLFFHDQSSPMTLEAALDIMGKLQSVLEDTLLKNLTLKENVDTLSKEIERLSKRTTTH